MLARAPPDSKALLGLEKRLSVGQVGPDVPGVDLDHHSIAELTEEPAELVGLLMPGNPSALGHLVEASIHR